MNQQQRKVWRLIKQAGAAGLHSFELRAEYVANPSQRVTELERMGYVFTHVRERLHGEARGTRYTLISEPGDAAPAFDPAGAPLLFDVAVGAAAPRSPFDESEAA